MHIKESVVIITGASSGIGAATARELFARGARLVLAARRVEMLHTLAQEIDPTGSRVLVVPTDVTQRADIDQLIARTVEQFQRIDVLINNAGVGSGKNLTLTEDALLEQVINVNLLAPARCCQAALPHMRDGGVIINIGSVAGEVATPGIYSATKFGLRGFSDALRRELHERKIAVVLIAPGLVASEMTAGFPYALPGAEIVAQAIARSIERPRRKVIVPWWYAPLTWLAKYLPGLTDYFFSLSRVKAARRR